MTVLLTGAGGQLGRSFERLFPKDGQLICTNKEELDISKIEEIESVCRSINPEVIVNAAAYTAVDDAEFNKELAYKINQIGVRNLAIVCKKLNIRLIHISTDFVFDGNKNNPYEICDETLPLNIYGFSKLAGEKELDVLGDKAVILRTSWVYSSFGKNFVKTILKLLNEKDEISVVCDQIGTPTSASSLASAIFHLLDKPELSGIYHWTDEGYTSWYEFALAIKLEAEEIGLIDRQVIIKPILSKDYPVAATRPLYSVLDKSRTYKDFEIKSKKWQTELKKVLQEILLWDK
jgi:dTDP-4-dehydrorhamnose reductase